MLYEDAINFLKDIPPFRLLDEETLKDVAGSLSMEFYPKGSVILRQNGPAGNALRIIKKGGVKVSLKSDGDEDIVIDYRGEGESFGLVSLMGKEKQKTTIIALSDTECYSLDRDKVLSLIDSQPALTEYFLQSHFTKYMDKTYREVRNRGLYYGGSDHILFTTPIEEIVDKEVVSVSDGATIQEAAQVMSHHKVSSVVILEDNALPAGIVTDRDLRENVVAKGRDVREPVRNIMSLPLIRVDAKDYCVEAVLKLLKYNVHHLLVIKEGALRGVITYHDLMLLQGKSPLLFAKNTESRQTIGGLVSVSKIIDNLTGFLLKRRGKGRQYKRG